ncbi:tripartite tricarboxylate transporter permease [Lutibaculum baratangense]|uniref:Tricarboxylate transport membrane protein TctA n=1 Tax=Lutibaculum baratangense AMV1 TaxID=631454 RepID=V4RNZ8_9HYPH|nr:tripartite tricarboxylate transporter permease [Lutibaculum baratangense]ESR24890.1 Tricarboxylate transport membrane protein TctA [Lutibaculum baratangense AMV1]
MENIALGLEMALTVENLVACFAGVFIGTAIGVIPGIGAMAAIALLLPMTFALDPTTGIVMLAGVYYGAEYGGSTASILLNLPGTPSNAITCLDGYPMAKAGRADTALFMTTIASFVGGSIGIVVLSLLTPAIVQVAKAFGPAEYFALILFCFVAVSTVGGADPKRNFAMVAIGALLGTVGVDIYDGVDRYTFGSHYLIDGIGLVPVAMGLFGLSEIIMSVRAGSHRVRHRVSFVSMLPTGQEWRRSALPMVRGALAGCFFGPLPGTGPSVAAIVSYANEKKLSKRPQEFGHGAIEGLAAPEASNNAAVQTAFVPTLALGIPGTPTMAIMIGALMIHGIVPGPLFISQEPQLFWGLVMSFWIGNVFLLLLNIPLIGLWVSFLNIPYRLLYPSIVILICVGSYSINNSVADVLVMLVVGVAGYVLRLHGFMPAPLLIGFVLSPMLEENFRRAMIMGRGDPTYLLSSHISAGALVLAGLLILSVVAGEPLRRRIAAARKRERATDNSNVTDDTQPGARKTP